MRLRVAYLLLSAGLFASGAQAQRGPALAPRDTVFDGYESQELRAMRQAEEEAFAARRNTEAFVSSSDATPSWNRNGIRSPDLPVRFDRRVDEFIRFFQENEQGHAILAGWLRRMPRWRAEIATALTTEGVPGDLAFVAMVESGFDPRTRSHAGAVGLWQLVPGTAREYGLLQDHWIDERMSPEASSRAAAQYLSDLHARFGSWELALAAYNMGYVALLRTLRKYNTNDFWALADMEAAIPFETSQYVAKIIACAIIGNNPERFGFGGMTADHPLEFETVDAPAGISLGLVARAIGSGTADDIARLNPELRRHRVPPGPAPFRLRVPRAHAQQFSANLARVVPARRPHRSYAVRFGEDLGQVAARFSTTTAELRDLNEIQTADVLDFGTTLLVPNVEERERQARDRVTVFVPSRVYAFPDRQRVFYAVRERDQLREIASFFRVTEALLREWNGLDDRAALQAGMTLQIFPRPDVDLSRAVVLREPEVQVLVVGSDEFFDWHEQRRGRVRVRVRAEAGDTLASLAERTGSTPGSLARINRIAPRAQLREGQEIIVYRDAQAPTDAQSPADAEASEVDGEGEPAPSADADDAA